ncbi:hypothetical protein BRADI_3g51092v3 [Brachypodium distachyon]|uniref:Uncharacterized protein n=1 Tax=Brachypodium distachyon TaxID=15368 RepID=A0A2K2D4J6_BRADI|nr:hypothetical protein BRADI_3g51092v3 [Brachypodium distachyon]
MGAYGLGAARDREPSFSDCKLWRLVLWPRAKAAASARCRPAGARKTGGGLGAARTLAPGWATPATRRALEACVHRRALEYARRLPGRSDSRFKWTILSIQWRCIVGLYYCNLLLLPVGRPPGPRSPLAARTGRSIFSARATCAGSAILRRYCSGKADNEEGGII